MLPFSDVGQSWPIGNYFVNTRGGCGEVTVHITVRKRAVL